MLPTEAKIEVSAPAKLNLFLAITGRREDGFHDLVSVVAKVAFGDTLQIERQAAGFALTCDDPAVPVGEENLVLKAARAYAAASGWSGGAHFFLRKRVPMGAGLGGGSSDAVAVLLGLNRLAERPLAIGPLTEIAARLGSDCPLFLKEGPVTMRGRGERIETLPSGAAARLQGRRVLIFKPAFGISTPWAYGRMVAVDRARRDSPTLREDKASRIYLPPTEAEARLADWVGGSQPAESLLYNNMERVAFHKFTALPVLLDRIQQRFGVVAGMSGSGSACFSLLGETTPAEPIAEAIRADWGPSVFVTETRIL